MKLRHAKKERTRAEHFALVFTFVRAILHESIQDFKIFHFLKLTCHLENIRSGRNTFVTKSTHELFSQNVRQLKMAFYPSVGYGLGKEDNVFTNSFERNREVQLHHLTLCENVHLITYR